MVFYKDISYKNQIFSHRALNGVECCIDQIARRKLDPYTAAEDNLDKILK